MANIFARKQRPQVQTSNGTEGRAGLVNSASSCYMNSTLQAMAACEPLQSLITYARPAVAHETSVGLRALSSEASDEEAQHLGDLPIMSAWVALLQELYSSSSSQKAIPTETLHRILSRKNPDYDGISQQDAHEALLAVLDQVRLEEVDLIKKFQPPPARPAPQTRQETDMTVTPHTVDTSSSESDSSDEEQPSPGQQVSKPLEPFIDTLFNGKLRSFIVCDTCKNVSISTEPFIDLSLAMQNEPPRRKSRLRSFFVRSSGDNSGASSAGTASDRPLTPFSKAADSATNSANAEEEEAVDSSDSSGEDENDEELDQKMSRSLNLGQAEQGSDASSQPKRRASMDPVRFRHRFSISRRRASIRTGSTGSEAEQQGGLQQRRSSLSTRRFARSPSRFPIDATAPVIEPEEETRLSSPVLERNLNKSESVYLKSVLAEVPAGTTTAGSPLDRLRVSHPGGSQNAVQPKQRDRAPSVSAATPIPADQDPSSSGLYRALQKFVSVEVLDGENAFQCKNCWKLTNPQFTKAGRQHLQDQTAGFPHPPNASSRHHEVERQPRGRQPSSMAVAEQVEPAPLATGDVEPMATVPEVEVTSANSTPSLGANKSLAPDPKQCDAGPDADTASTSGSSTSDAGADADSEEDDSDDAKRDTSAVSSKANSSLQPDPKSSVATSPAQSVESVQSKQKKPPKSERYVARKAHKRYLIADLPPILIMHFNRFQHSKPGLLAQSIGNPLFTSLRKIDEFVSFPSVLDMSPFLAPAGKAPKIGQRNSDSSTAMSTEKDNHNATGAPSAATDEQRQQPSKGRRRSSTVVPNAVPPEADPRLSQCNYRLVAVVSHTGSMASGHYTSYVNVPIKNPEGKQATTTTNSDTALDELNSPIDAHSKPGEGGPVSATAPPSLHGDSASKQPESQGASPPQSSAGQPGSPDVERQWLYCSDEEIRPASFMEAMSCKAYLLYYERIEQPDPATPADKQA